jgi:predicted metal-dependent peptidase
VADYKEQLIIDKLVTGRIALLLKHPFFGNLATRLKLVNADDWCPTAGTDGRHFYYNTKFIDSLTPKETEFLFGHEVLHNVFEHMLVRIGDRDPQLWNIAADYAVNQILKDANIGDMPKGARKVRTKASRTTSTRTGLQKESTMTCSRLPRRTARSSWRNWAS